MFRVAAKRVTFTTPFLAYLAGSLSSRADILVMKQLKAKLKTFIENPTDKGLKFRALKLTFVARNVGEESFGGEFIISGCFSRSPNPVIIISIRPFAGYRSPRVISNLMPHELALENY